MLEERPLPTVAPVHYFQLSAPLRYCAAGDRLGAAHAIPSTADLAMEQEFASLFMGWNEGELRVAVRSRRTFNEGTRQRLDRSDSLELFIDTRDLKTASFYTRFCHHFYLLLNPAAEEPAAAEISRFRNEESHPLCVPDELVVETKRKGEVEIRIPATCLFGYDPEQFPRLGFTYRLNRKDGAPQHFGGDADTYKLDQLPALWSSLRLERA